MEHSDNSGETKAEGMERVDDSGETKTKGMERADGSGETKAEGMKHSDETGEAKAEGMKHTDGSGETKAEGMKHADETGEAKAEGMKHTDSSGETKAEGMKHADETGEAKAEGMKHTDGSEETKAEGMKRADETEETKDEGMKHADETGETKTKGMERADDSGETKTEGMKHADETGEAKAEGMKHTDGSGETERMKHTDGSGETKAEGMKHADETGEAKAEGMKHTDGSGVTKAEGMKHADETGEAKAEGMKHTDGSGETKDEGMKHAGETGEAKAEGMKHTDGSGKTKAEGVKHADETGEAKAEGMKHTDGSGKTKAEGMKHADETGEAKAEGMKHTDGSGKTKAEGMKHADETGEAKAEGMKHTDGSGETKAEGMKLADETGEAKAEGMKHTFLIPCRWKSCTFSFNGIYECLKHVDDHCDQSSDKIDICPWTGCYKTFGPWESQEAFQAHIYRHVVHAKLLAVGASYVKNKDLNSCPGSPKLRKHSFDNMQTDMQCEWETCNKSFTNPQLFYSHVQEHCEVYVKETQAQTGHEHLTYPCKWAECKQSLQGGIIRKIKRHVKSHTHEKAIACPECEYMFSDNSAFLTHRPSKKVVKQQGKTKRKNKAIMKRKSTTSEMYPSKRSLTTDEKGIELGNKNLFTDETNGFPLAPTGSFGDFKFFSDTDGIDFYQGDSKISTGEEFGLNLKGIDDSVGSGDFDFASYACDDANSPDILQISNSQILNNGWDGTVSSPTEADKLAVDNYFSDPAKFLELAQHASECIMYDEPDSANPATDQNVTTNCQGITTDGNGRPSQMETAAGAACGGSGGGAAAATVEEVTDPMQQEREEDIELQEENRKLK